MRGLTLLLPLLLLLLLLRRRGRARHALDSGEAQRGQRSVLHRCQVRLALGAPRLQAAQPLLPPPLVFLQVPVREGGRGGDAQRGLSGTCRMLRLQGWGGGGGAS